jgi:Na+/melibiose symporter-like transporter
MGFALTMAGYVASEGDAVVTQPESAITMIRMMYSLVPLVLMVMLAVSAFAISKLSKRMPEIEAKISAEHVAE